tara:strand:+ start:1652 stop:3388 length:1737 start_codon:yes stop_codon:yes gene_type:complete
MIFLLKNILIILGIYLSNCNLVALQTNTNSLNDSIIKYKSTNYQKALEYGFEALDSFQDEDDVSLDFVNTNYYLGEIFFYMGDYKSSFEYLYESLKLYDQLNPNQRTNKNVIKPPWVLVIMGNVYYQIKKYENAEKFYNEALENFKLFDSDYEDEKYFGINVSLQNIALVKRDQGDLESAFQLLNQVLERRKEYANKEYANPVDLMSSHVTLVDFFRVSGNEELLLENLNKIKTYYEAYLFSNSEINLEYELNLSTANRLYASFLSSKGRYAESLEYLLSNKGLLKDLPLEISKVNSEISNIYYLLGMNGESKDLILENINSKQLNNIEKLKSFKLLERIYTDEKSIENLLSVKDSIIFYNELPINTFQEEEFNRLENLILISEKQNDLNISKLRTNRVVLISIISISILLIVLLSLKFNYDIQKERNNNLSIEKNKINDELDMKKRELFSKINFISQRNDYLNKIREQINTDPLASDNMKKLEAEIESVTVSEKAYQEFDRMFSAVYPNFYKRLNIITRLSQTDIRLASYIKMNHSNNEISRISGISLRTVESQRYRLSKKLQLNKGQDLNQYIINI